MITSTKDLAQFALISFAWKSFPSKKSHGQHMSQGTGAPQASLANRAVSTPIMKSAANWEPLAVTKGS